MKSKLISSMYGVTIKIPDAVVVSEATDKIAEPEPTEPIKVQSALKSIADKLSELHTTTSDAGIFDIPDQSWRLKKVLT